MSNLSELAANAQAQAIANLLLGGFLDIMTGDMPESADDKSAREDQRLARCQLASIPFAMPENGLLTANVIGKTIAIRDGEPTWFRLKTSDEMTVIDGGPGDMLKKLDKLVAGQIVSIAEYVHRVVK